MHGNVLEWVSDWHGDYSSAAVTDPQGPDSGTYRVVRGGSWKLSAGDARSAARNGSESGLRGGILGFRCARVQGP